MGTPHIRILFFCLITGAASFSWGVDGDAWPHEACVDEGNRIHAAASVTAAEVQNCIQACTVPRYHARYREMSQAMRLCQARANGPRTAGAINPLLATCRDLTAQINASGNAPSPQQAQQCEQCRITSDMTQAMQESMRPFQRICVDAVATMTAPQNAQACDPTQTTCEGVAGPEGPGAQPCDPATQTCPSVASAPPGGEAPPPGGRPEDPGPGKTGGGDDVPTPGSPSPSTGGPAIASPNPMMLQNLMGAGNRPTPVDRANFDPINFTNGPTSNADYMGIANRGGGDSSNFVKESPYNRRDALLAIPQMGPVERKGGAPPPGGGAPPPPFGGSPTASNPPPSSNAPNRGGAAGGPRTSAATASLSKIGQNSFYAAGGGMASGGKGVKGKKNGPRGKYKAKTDDSSQTLGRLFGPSPASVYPGRGGGGWGRSCLDTVFCSMESFFNGIERYPNSDIKGTSH